MRHTYPIPVEAIDPSRTEFRRLDAADSGHFVSVTTAPDDIWAAAADAADLHHGSDDEPGIARRRCGKGFTYRDDSGATIGSAARERIVSLAIPPAWTDVWVRKDADSHLQATGRDDRGRKQYLYHERWRVARDEAKFVMLADFAQALPEIRRRVAMDLGDRRVTRSRALAGVVRLLDTTLIRIGTERYAAENETFGATTLEPRHVSRTGGVIHLAYTAKSNLERDVVVSDPDVIALIDESLEHGAAQVFCFVGDDDTIHDVTSTQVNDYLSETAGTCATAKTFRTWGATSIAVGHLADTDDGSASSTTRFLAAVDVAAAALGNTRAVCRSCYVAPAVAAAVDDRSIDHAWASSRSGRWRSRAESAALKLL